MSKKARDILAQFHLCPHKFYPLGLYKRKIKNDYFLFHYHSDYSDFVDYEKTSFREKNRNYRYKSDSFLLKSQKEYLEKRKTLKEKDICWAYMVTELL